MEKEKRITSYVKEAKVLTIYGNLDGKRYADSWLALCNNKRENKEFLELINFYGSNKIRATIDISKISAEDLDEVIEHYKAFFESWGLEITRADIDYANVCSIDYFELNDGDREVYLQLEY